MAYRESYYLENMKLDDPAEEQKRMGRLGEVMNLLELINDKEPQRPDRQPRIIRRHAQ